MLHTHTFEVETCHSLAIKLTQDTSALLLKAVRETYLPFGEPWRDVERDPMTELWVHMGSSYNVSCPALTVASDSGT